MDPTPRIRIAVTMLFILAMFTLSSTGARGSEPEPRPTSGAVVVVEGGTPAQRAVLAGVLTRFRMAGLTVRHVVIRFQPDQRVCGTLGGFIGVEDGVRVIVTCLRPDNGLRHNLFHEIGHAWEADGGLTEDVRRLFLSQRGLRRWHDTRRDDWPYRGAEQAVEIVAWGLEDQKRPIPTRVGGVGRQDDASLWLAFETLTGRGPLWAERVG